MKQNRDSLTDPCPQQWEDDDTSHVRRNIEHSTIAAGGMIIHLEKIKLELYFVLYIKVSLGSIT